MARLIRTPFLFTMSATLAAGAAPLGAQQRVEVTTRREARAPAVGAEERELRQLERRVDSLARVYNDGDGLTMAERRRIGSALDATMGRIEAVLQRLASSAAGLKPGAPMQVQVAPLVPEGAARSIARALGAARESAPRGWIGIEALGPARVPWVARGELMIRYLAYPEIVSVEPSSPAERAGIVPSDTLVAYDGHDVRDSDVPINRLLRPNARVLVRVRRDGRTRDVPVMAADVPQRIRLRGDVTVVQAPLPPAAGRPGFAPSPVTMSMPAAPVAPAAPLPPFAPLLDIAYDAIAGAKLAAVTQGLGRTLGVRRGVLVTSAPVSSLAHDSGLRDGDVITSAGGRAVRTVAELRDLVAAAVLSGEHILPLRIIRERKAASVTLRWDDGR